MKTKNVLITGCAVLGVMAIAVCGGSVLFVAHFVSDVEGVAVTVNGPMDVVIGQTFDLDVIVKNDRSGQLLSVSDVDISDEYLAGFTVSSVKPTPKSSTHVPIENSQSFTFDVSVPPGESMTFTYTLRAEKAGIYRGDVDVCEGMQFITGMAQTVVSEKE